MRIQLHLLLNRKRRPQLVMKLLTMNLKTCWMNYMVKGRVQEPLLKLLCLNLPQQLPLRVLGVNSSPMMSLKTY